MQREVPAVWRAYSPGVAAEILHVPVKQIYAAIKRGDLAAVRIGRHFRISDSSLRSFAGQAESEAA